MRPILANGIDEWLGYIASSSPGTPVVQVLASAARVALNSPAATPDAIALIRRLQRTVPGDPAIRRFGTRGELGQRHRDCIGARTA